MPTLVFKNWMKANTGMKLITDSAYNRTVSEGITSFDSLLDFDKKSIQTLPTVCKVTITAIPEDLATGQPNEPAVPGANVSVISTQRLIVAMHAANYYTSIGGDMSPINMHWTHVLSLFKDEWEDFESLKKQDDPTVPLISDKDHDRKIIKWAPIFLDCTFRTYGSRGPLSYVLRTNATVPLAATDPLDPHFYYGTSGSLQDELTARLPHTGAIYKNDNATVYMMVEKASRDTSVTSTVSAFSRRKDGRGAYLALIANHAGDVKYRSILKKKMTFLQSTKWNGRAFPLETHVSNHRSAVDDLSDCSQHITVAIPVAAQRVEYLIDSITCSDPTLQAAIGLIRANTNNMRNDFEKAASSLIEVDPYKRANKGGGNPRQGNISALDFKAGRGTTGVDLRWHTVQEYKNLGDDQRVELQSFMRSEEGKKLMKKSRAAAAKKRNTDSSDKGKAGTGNWKKKMKKALKSPHGIKTVMAILGEEEKTNQGFISALNTPAALPLPPIQVPPVAQPPRSAQTSALAVRFPITSVKLQSILKK